MAPTYRALWVTETVTYTDHGGVPPTPADALHGGLGAFLDRMRGPLAGDGVILLDAGAARALELPADDLRQAAGAEMAVNCAAAIDAGRAGWHLTNPSDWIQAYGDGRPTLHIGIVPLMDRGRSPLLAVDELDTVTTHAQWHSAAGTPWFGSPGMAGHQILRQIGPQLVAGRTRREGQTPTWKPKITGPDNGWEGPYEREHWRGPDRTSPYAYALDWNRAYVGAMGNVRLCPWSLRHTGRIRFDAKLSGWWQVELAPWTFDRLPDPAGYAPGDPDDRTAARIRWITTPTLELLEWATDQGIYGGVRILDSFTGTGYELLKPLKDRLRDAFDYSWTLPECDRERLQRAVKDVGHEMPGMWKRSSNWVHRPDWWYSIVAMSRCNLWRKMWHAGQSGIWPLWISTDKVWYPSDTPEYRTPPGYTIDKGQALGNFTCEGLKRRKVSR